MTSGRCGRVRAFARWRPSTMAVTSGFGLVHTTNTNGFCAGVDSRRLGVRPCAHLSIREREPRTPAPEPSEDAGFADTLPKILPLPGGEGWGEGERGHRTIAADPNTSGTLQTEPQMLVAFGEGTRPTPPHRNTETPKHRWVPSPGAPISSIMRIAGE